MREIVDFEAWRVGGVETWAKAGLKARLYTDGSGPERSYVEAGL
jgi:hypothetical protein